MFDLFVQIFNNKLLFYGIIVVIACIIFTIILIKKAGKENKEDTPIDVERVDGEKSLFDEVLENNESMKTSDGKLDLESMIEKMQKDLEAKASEVIEKFENEQEEKSVISYQELIKNAQTEENKNVSVQEIEEESNEEIEPIEVEPTTQVPERKISLNEIMDKMDKKVPTMETEEDVNEIYLNTLELEEDSLLESQSVSDEITELVSSKVSEKEDFVNAIKTGDLEEDAKESKFKSTEFISPIYGVQDIKMQYPTVQNMKELKNASNYNKFELEQTLNIEPLSDEIRKNEDFLNALKEFRKNLE